MLSVSIYRHAVDHHGLGADCSNEGVTSLARCPMQRAILLDEEEPVPDRVPAEHALLRLVRRAPSWMGHIAVPVQQPPGLCGPMFGGCFVYTSDSRFVQLIGIYPIGNLVRLNTSEIAVVRKIHAPDPYRPQVRVLFGRSGVRLDLPYDLNLWEVEPGQDLPSAVVAPLDPTPYDIDPLALM